MEKRESSLFKYRPINLNTLESIRDNYLYFNKPSMFNDPFDCMLNICLDESKNEYNNASLEKRDKFLANYRILSLSSNNKEILLWSHYADEHKGICLEYRTVELYDNHGSVPMHGIYFDPTQVQYQHQASTPDNLIFADKVDYKDELPKKYNILTDDPIELKRFIYTKYSRWIYEDEWRIILPKECIPANSCAKLIPAILKGITFGTRTTKRDIMNVQTFLSQSQNVADVEISKAVPLPDSYAINIKKYDSFSLLLEDN
jgi:hypothetical protein